MCLKSRDLQRMISWNKYILSLSFEHFWLHIRRIPHIFTVVFGRLKIHLLSFTVGVKFLPPVVSEGFLGYLKTHGFISFTFLPWPSMVSGVFFGQVKPRRGKVISTPGKKFTKAFKNENLSFEEPLFCYFGILQWIIKISL